MRVFIGIKLSDHVHEEIEKFLKPFKKSSTPIRWVKPENVHLTLKFIGEIPEEKYRQIARCLGEIQFNTGPFQLKLSGCGKFGRGDTLNILWIGVNTGNALKEIYNRIENSLAKIHIEKENRPFKAHITVGRNKKNYNFKNFFQLMEEKSHQPITEFTVSGFQIFESKLKPEGPMYKILKEITLAQT